MKNVEGKTAFITGGASGAGFGMAKVFSGNGMKVVIADIRKDSLERAMAQFKNNPDNSSSMGVYDNLFIIPVSCFSFFLRNDS